MGSHASASDHESTACVVGCSGVLVSCTLYSGCWVDGLSSAVGSYEYARTRTTYIYSSYVHVCMSVCMMMRCRPRAIDRSCGEAAAARGSMRCVCDACDATTRGVAAARRRRSIDACDQGNTQMGRSLLRLYYRCMGRLLLYYRTTHTSVVEPQE